MEDSSTKFLRTSLLSITSDKLSFDKATVTIGKKMVKVKCEN